MDSGMFNRDSFYFNIRPAADKRFDPLTIRQIMKEILDRQCFDVYYEQSQVSSLSQRLRAILIEKLKELNLDNYKYLVNVFIGEQRGAGISMHCQAHWDTDTDSYASYSFNSEQIFCICTVFAVYNY